MKDNMVTLEVTDKGAIYVNNNRITDRSTKWGIHNIVFQQLAKKEDVVKTLKAYGFPTNKIDEPEYME
jgi:hypothetical protein